MRTRHLVAALLVSAALTPTPAPAQSGAVARKIFSSDTLSVVHAQTSPDGKWLVMAVSRGTSSSLWITRTDGGPLLRLTSDGHSDQRPRWFARGDRIVFESSRPNRDGGRQGYLMTLEIDAATGKPVGAPRQVSGEPVLVSGLPSPDGRWLSYISIGTPSQVKVVPATGGAARSLAEAVPYLPSFSPDSRHVYFVARGAIRGKPCPVEECELVLKQVPVGGGPAQVLSASTGRPIGVVTGDPRFTIQGIQRLGLGPVDSEIFRTLDGREVGMLDLPRGTVVTGPTGDGLGMMVRSNEFDTPIRIVPASGGKIRTLTEGGKNWPEAWMPSGDVLITDRPARNVAGAWDPTNNGLAVELLPVAGGSGKLVPLPAGAGGSGWNSSVGPWFSYLTGSPRALHVVNVTTGQTRTLTQRLASIGIAGRGGMEQDGPSMVYMEDTPEGLSVTSTNPETGETSRVRTFAREPDAPTRWGYSVHGSRLLYFTSRGDSVDLVLSTGPAVPPRRLGTWSGREIAPDGQAVWSWKGDRIAICGRGGGDHHPILMILTLPSSPSGSIDRQDFDLGIGEVCWSQKWQPDDRGIFMAAMAQAGASRADVVHLEIAPGSRPIVLTRDDPFGPGEYLPSPDGNYVAYPVTVAKGSSIYVVDLKPLLKLPK